MVLDQALHEIKPLHSRAVGSVVQKQQAILQLLGLFQGRTLRRSWNDEGGESPIFSAGVDRSVVAPKESTPQNPWNRFQKDHKGKGLSKKTMSQIYQYEKTKK